MRLACCYRPAPPLALPATRQPQGSHFMPSAKKLLLLAGDGIGQEVMAEVKRLLAFFARTGIATFDIEEGLIGGCCYDAHGVAITDATIAIGPTAGCGAFTSPFSCSTSPAHWKRSKFWGSSAF